MLLIFFRTLIVLIFLVIGLRMMGKRQIGEMQPFEFVITLAIAELACSPMQDVYIPLTYGIVPLFSVFIIHFVVTKLSTKYIAIRKFVNGKPVIVINGDGIDYKTLKNLNMNVNDLMESLRGQGIFSVEQVLYAVIETNGKLSILEDENATPPTTLPVSLIVEGSLMRPNLLLVSMTAQEVDSLLKKHHLKTIDVILMSTYDTKIFIQPKNKKYIVENKL